MPIALIATAEAETLRTVDVCAALVVPTAWFANVRLVGVNDSAEVTPVPVRLTFCVPLPALSVKRRVALRAPVAVGVKVTVAVHVALTASVAGETGHVFVWL
jgi:hypothetical protein